MVTDHWPDAPWGIPVGHEAPDIHGEDIEGRKLKLKDVLKEYNGVLLFIFRGTW
jgi:peroxiredoxin